MHVTVDNSTPKGTDKFTCGSLKYSMRGLAVLFAWMLWGDFCFTLMETVVPSILPLKLRSLESPNVVIGFIMSTLPGIFNITITPMVSFKSDRHRSKLGRRIPFILYTMPFLTLSLIFIGFSDSIGQWVNGTFFSGNAASEAKVIIILLAVFAAMFDLFNMFVNTVYWYLFNDVVPEPLIGRFMGWFKLVGTLTAAVYNFFIFRYAESHMREIFLGAALLYLIGFGLMCLRVKEGEYPPPPADVKKKPSFIDNCRTFGRECYTMRYYWDIFLTYAFMAMAGSIGVFNIFFQKSLGLDLNLIGKMGAFTSIAVAICLSFSGFLVDRWNAVRVAAYIAAFTAFASFGNWVWLFIDQPPPMIYVYISVCHASIFGALFGALNSMIEMPRLMELFPRERFGQFCGSIALLRAPAHMIGGVCAGAYIDIVKHFYPTGNYAYRFNFIWHGVFIILAFYFHYRTFRAWKRLGGEVSYKAPSVPFKLSSLKPREGDTGKVTLGLLAVVGIAFLGQVAATSAWIVYYYFFAHDLYVTRIFAIALGVIVVNFLIYLRFIKFMERP